MYDERRITAAAMAANKQYFNSELPIHLLTFKTKAMGQICGNFRGQGNRSGIITINSAILKPNVPWEKTLIHELIHFWQYVNGYNASHGHTFHRMARTIYNRGYKYLITTKNNVPEISEAIKSAQPEIISFMVEKNGFANFFRNLSLRDLRYLQSKGYEISTVTINKSSFTHCKNIDSFCKRKYHYSLSKPEIVKAISNKREVK